MGIPTIRRSGIRDVECGDGVVIHEPVNLYGCRIGNEVMIGPFVEIQKGAVIGDRSRIQSHVFICEGVTIGADCFISHGVMFINDKFERGGPAKGDRSLWKATFIGDGVSIGTGAVILPVSICAGSIVGAGAVVTHDINEPGVYVGNPARWLRESNFQ